MSSFKVKFKLQGLELEIEGERDDIPQIVSSIGDQLTGILLPAVNIVEGQQVEQEYSSRSKTIDVPTSPVRKTVSRRRKPVSNTPANKQSTPPVEWKHDLSKWGMPKQTWSISEKIIWFMYVAFEEARIMEMTSSMAINGFNQAFKQAGLINLKNAKRNFDHLKTAMDANEDTTKTPSFWSLTESGIKKGLTLISDAKGKL